MKGGRSSAPGRACARSDSFARNSLYTATQLHGKRLERAGAQEGTGWRTQEEGGGVKEGDGDRPHG